MSKIVRIEFELLHDVFTIKRLELSALAAHSLFINSQLQSAGQNCFNNKQIKGTNFQKQSDIVKSLTYYFIIRKVSKNDPF